jgi:HK97 family phage prohead protease
MPQQYDFSGWATRHNILCADGRTILKDAFKHNDGRKVSLVWNHQHNDPFNVLGNAILEHRDEGVYAYCSFNDTEQGQNAKTLVEHGDIGALSIFANHLRHKNGKSVCHGEIREVSLVLSSANSGAFIDSVIQHSGEESDDEAVIYTGEPLSLKHSDENEEEKEETETVNEAKPALQHAEDQTIEDVINSMTEEQQNVLYGLIGQAYNKTEEEETVKHNLFDQETETPENTLSHADTEAIFADVKRYGSLRDSALAHGIDNIDYLFPEAKALNTPPEFIKRDTGWVQKVMSGVHHTPFSRIKSMFADLTEDAARAKGYIKGNMKKEQVFGLLKRTTSPTTVYKKQKLDRDDIIDIVDFDVVAWLKYEMRFMLDEELARAYLFGDGRQASDDDKINELNIRPIWTDEDLFTLKVLIDVASTANADQKAKAFIRAAIKARKNYKGSGHPTLFTTEDNLTDCLLMEDATGRIIYDSVDKLATAMRVKEIISVPVMEGLTRTNTAGDTLALQGIIVNLDDYNVGADKGGSVNMFEDFDIDYNAQKYLIETRCSGALTKPFSAIALETTAAAG